jgi:hypothetical protein
VLAIDTLGAVAAPAPDAASIRAATRRIERITRELRGKKAQLIAV